VGGIVVGKNLGGGSIFVDRITPAIKCTVGARTVEAIRPLARIALHGRVKVWQRFGCPVLAHEDLTKVVARFRLVRLRLGRGLEARDRRRHIAARVRGVAGASGIRALMLRDGGGIDRAPVGHPARPNRALTCR
jgi:hypothetical protein